MLKKDTIGNKIENKDTIYAWIFVFVAITLHFLFTTGKYDASIPLANTIHYGVYMFKRGFLVIAALGVLAYWLTPFKKIFAQIKKNLTPIVIILIAMLLAHFMSFNMWFGWQDVRTFTEGVTEGVGISNLQYVENPYYPMMTFYLARHMFATNFVFYNAFGLLAYFLSGVGIFWLLNRVQANRTISFLAALFFVTTPTFFQDTLNMTEFIGDGFSLVLFVLSIYLYIRRFYAGAIIFAATAMEFGISRTNFIAVPLVIAGLLFVPIVKSQKLLQIITLIAFPLLFLLNKWVVFDYGATHFNEFGNPFTNYPVNELILKFFATLFGVSIPHKLAQIAINISQVFMGNSVYIAPLLGFLFTIVVLLLILFSLYRKNMIAAKVLFFGLITLVGGTIGPTLFGVSRLMQDISKLTSQFADILPTTYTIYGVFPAFAVSLLIAGIVLLFPSKKMKIVLFVVILLNIKSAFSIETLASNWFAKPKKEMNEQLVHLLPKNGKQKLVYIPENPKDRLLYDGAMSFKTIFMPLESVGLTDDPKTFIKLINTYSLSPDQLYFFVHAKTSTKIYDFSHDLRRIPREKLADEFQVLVQKAEEKAN